MNIRFGRFLSPAVVALMVAACGGDAAETSGSSWEHTTSTEGNVTTVRNTAGSQWGADARLVEELSIGELEGADEYAFGMIAAIWPTEDRIYVGDMRLPAARAYDLDGNFVMDIGTIGQGPGEYESVTGLIGLPDGRVALHDGEKLLIYDHDGNYVESWGSAENSGFRFQGPGMFSVTDNGDIYLRKMIRPEGGGFNLASLKFEMRQALPGALGEGIPAPEFDYEQPMHQMTMGDSAFMMPVPFTPSVQWAMMPDGGFVAGVADDYGFEIHKPDGRVVKVEKYWTPVPVQDGELRIQTSGTRININGSTPELDWSDVDIPDTKPAYRSLVPTRDGRVIVVRQGVITINPDCLDPSLTASDMADMECTQSSFYGDVFDADGGFLGTFDVPAGANVSTGAYIDGDIAWLPVQDDLGTVMVKRYRIVTPRDPETT